MFPLISKKDLFKDPDRQLVRCSPDAIWISFIQRHERQQTLVVQMRTDNQRKKTICLAEKILDYWWSQCGQLIFYLAVHEKLGFELFSVNLNSSNVTSLMTGAYIKWVEQFANLPGKFYFNLKKIDEKCFSIYEFDLSTGSFDLLYQNDGFMDYVLDTAGHVRFAIKMTTLGGEIVDVKKRNQAIASLNQHDLLLLHRYPDLRPRLSKTHLYFVSSESTTCARLLAFQLGTGKFHIMAEDGHADIVKVIYHPYTRMALACYSEGQKIQWQGTKDDISAHLNLIARYKDSDYVIVDQSLDNQFWLISHLDDRKPAEYSYYQLSTQEIVPIFQENIEDFVCETECLTIPARDNLQLPCYLTRSSIEPCAPLVILLHGGPHSRESWGWLPTHQLLSNRGYHVLSLNFRGSTGFGREHLVKANGQWGGKIIDDIKDAADFLIHMNIVSPGKIGLMGTSYGGYAALMALIKYPDDFACAIDLMGPVDLNKMFAQLPPEWTQNYALINQMMNIDVMSEDGKNELNNISPINQAVAIQKPIMIGHGMRDPIIKYTESIKMVETLASHQIPVTGILFKNEGHAINEEQNKISWYHCVEKFFSQFLGGQCEEGVNFTSNQNIEIIQDDLQILKDVKATTSV